MFLSIPRFCNKCGKSFIYGIQEEELHQQKQNVEYICDDCLYGLEWDVFSWNRINTFIYLLEQYDKEYGTHFAYYLSQAKIEHLDRLKDILERVRK